MYPQICNPRELPSHAWGPYRPDYQWNRGELLNGPVQTQHIVFAKDLDGALPGEKLCQAWCVLEARVEIVDVKRRFGHNNVWDYPIVHVDTASVLEFLCDVPSSAFCLVRLLTLEGEIGETAAVFEARCERSPAINVYMMMREQLHRTWQDTVATQESDQLHATVSSLEISEMTTDDTDLRQFTDDLASTFGSFYDSHDGMRRAHSTSSLHSQSEQEIRDDTDQPSFGEEGEHEDIAHAYIAPESDVVACTSAPETATEPMKKKMKYTTPTVPMASGKEEMNASNAFTLEQKENVEMNVIERLVWDSNSWTPEQKKEIWQARDMMVGPRSRVREKPTPVAKSACRFLDLK